METKPTSMSGFGLESFIDFLFAVSNGVLPCPSMNKALTHSSYANEHGTESNERLELLGDAVISLACVEYLFRKYPNATEGELTERKTTLVNGKQLAEIGKLLRLEGCLKLGNGEVLSQKTLGRAVEAVIGAYYDFTLSQAQVSKLLHEIFDKVEAGEIPQTLRNYKGILQKWSQQVHKQDPKYYLVNNKGPAHDKTFTMNVLVDGCVLGSGIGKSKKDAEQQAAQKALSQKGLL